MEAVIDMFHRAAEWHGLPLWFAWWVAFGFTSTMTVDLARLVVTG